MTYVERRSRPIIAGLRALVASRTATTAGSPRSFASTAVSASRAVGESYSAGRRTSASTLLAGSVPDARAINSRAFSLPEPGTSKPRGFSWSRTSAPSTAAIAVTAIATASTRHGWRSIRSASGENTASGVSIGEQGDAGAGGFRADQLQVAFVARLSEQALPRTERHRKDHELVLVDQATLVEDVDELTAPVDQQVPTGLLFQLRDLVGRIAFQQRSVPRQRLLESPRGDELGQCVHPNCELALGLLHRRPRGRETFEGHAPQQERVTREEQLRLVLLELLVEVRIRPAAALDLAYSAGVGHRPVERHVLRRDHPTHCSSLSFRRALDQSDHACRRRWSSRTTGRR